MAAFVAGCSNKPSKAEEQQRAAAKAAASGSTGPGAWQDLSFEKSDDAPEGQLAALFAPEGSKDWPLLVALHGRGEAGRGLAAGAHGWRDDYDIDVIRTRLEAGALTRADSKEMLSDARVGEIVAALARDPWRGLRIACPYCPVPSGDFRAFGRFVTGPLLSRAGKPARAATGIDGVSMGGRYALEIGFGLAAHFGSVGALQPAIRESEAEDFAARAEAARDAHGSQSIQLVTSTGDAFREATVALSEALKKKGVAHRLKLTDGPHDYIWNRGPGAIEMLMFHERALRGGAPP
ncbi:MAG: esterase [Myxococcales bacterium]|nr:esterase [Myxococcales bacterium]